jgi:hypothetical protein
VKLLRHVGRRQDRRLVPRVVHPPSAAELKETHVLSTSLGEVGPRSGEGDFEVRDDLEDGTPRRPSMKR